MAEQNKVVVEQPGGSGRIGVILAGLPAVDIFLRMQATNLELVDTYLRQLEADLLRRYFEIERTPVPDAMFVSAMSQLWIFGVYEFLRTWRQRVNDLLLFHQMNAGSGSPEKEVALAAVREKHTMPLGDSDETASSYFHYEQVATSDDFAYEIRKALDGSELLYRRLEALRVMLAKHELPRQKRVPAMAPGYGRIDMSDGSIYWQVELTRLEVDTVSRRSIAIGIESMADNIEHRILSADLQDKVRLFSKFSYGTKKVTAVCRDGSRFPGTLISWNRIVVAVLEHEDVPFDANDLVDLEPEEGSIEDDAPQFDEAF